MTSLESPVSLVSDSKSPAEEKTSVNEKDVEISSTESLRLSDADEALELVGMRRTAEFSEEYMLKLRRKLVSHYFSAQYFSSDTS